MDSIVQYNLNKSKLDFSHIRITNSKTKYPPSFIPQSPTAPSPPNPLTPSFTALHGLCCCTKSAVISERAQRQGKRYEEPQSTSNTCLSARLGPWFQAWRLDEPGHGDGCALAGAVWSVADPYPYDCVSREQPRTRNQQGTTCTERSPKDVSRCESSGRAAVNRPRLRVVGNFDCSTRRMRNLTLGYLGSLVLECSIRLPLQQLQIRSNVFVVPTGYTSFINRVPTAFFTE